MFYSRFCYVYMYVCNVNGDGRNGQTTQAGAQNSRLRTGQSTITIVSKKTGQETKRRQDNR